MHMMTCLYDNGALCSTLICIDLIGPTRCYIMYDDRYNTTVGRAAVPLVYYSVWSGAGLESACVCTYRYAQMPECTR